MYWVRRREEWLRIRAQHLLCQGAGDELYFGKAYKDQSPECVIREDKSSSEQCQRAKGLVTECLVIVLWSDARRFVDRCAVACHIKRQVYRKSV
jgi:hypothetical protein